jgi:ATP-dependent Lhr-like helicase
MAKMGKADDIRAARRRRGRWRRRSGAAIHPRLLELIRAHRSTLIFVNSRRLAERLAGALNELAGETLVRSHHGSLARPQRVEIEDLLKAGALRALVATSSLELGIDMGAIDLVVQIEAPPSVASGCSASAAPATRSAPSAKASSSRSSAATSSRAPR